MENDEREKYLKLLEATGCQLLRDIKRGMLVNLYGVVVTYKEPKKSSGTDYTCSIMIADPSRGMSLHNDTSINLFHRDMQTLPKFQREGDIFVLRTAKVQSFNNKLQCTAIKGKSTWAVFHRDNEQQEPAFIPGMSLSLDDNDRNIIKILRDWYSSIIQQNSMATVITPGSVNLPKLPISQAGQRLRNVEHITKARDYFDLIAEVVGYFSDVHRNMSQLQLTDYTKNDYLQPHNEETTGIIGPLVVKCSCYDEHHHKLPKLSIGSFVFLRNTYSRKDKNECIEIRLSGDRLAGLARPGVHVLETSDPRLQPLLKRRQEYLKSVAAERNTERFAPPSENTVWTVTKHKFTPTTPLSVVISASLPINKFKVRACVVDYKPRDIKEMARPWCSSCKRTSPPCNKTQLSCLICMAKIKEYKFQFAALLQDPQGHQLPVIFYDRDAEIFLSGSKAANLYIDENAANELADQLEAICPSRKTSSIYFDFCIQSYQIDINSQKIRRFRVFDTILKIH